MKAFIKKIRVFLSSPSHSRTLVLIGLLVVLAAIPLTVIVLQQRTNFRQHAMTISTGVRNPDCVTNRTVCGNDALVSDWCNKSYPSNHLVHIVGTNVCATNCTDIGQAPAGQCGVPVPAAPPPGQQDTHDQPNSACGPSYSTANNGTCGFNNVLFYCLGPNYSTNNWYVKQDCKATGQVCDTQRAGVADICAGNQITVAPTPKQISCTGSCEMYKCNAGQVAASGTCSTGEEVCCVSGTPTYKCVSPGNTTNTSIAGTDGSTTFCPDKYVCSSTSSVPSSTGPSGAQSQLCSIAQAVSFSKNLPNGYQCYDSGASAPNNSYLTNPWTKSYSFCSSSDVCVNLDSSTAACVSPSVLQCTCDGGSGNGFWCGNYSGSKLFHRFCSKGVSCDSSIKMGWPCGTSTTTTSAPVSTSPATDTTTPAVSGPIGSGCGSNCGGTDTTTPGSGSGGSSCTNGQTTGFSLSLKLEGIGTGSLENNAPARPTRYGYYEKITDESGTTVYSNPAAQFVYNSSTGTFNAPNIDLGTTLSCGHTYTLKVKIPGYVKASTAITYGTTNTLTMNPIQGDFVADNNNNILTQQNEIIGDDIIDIFDYNILKACKDVDPTTSVAFNNNTQTVNISCRNIVNLFDYADGGTQGDEWSYNYNLWARGLVRFSGQ